MTHVLAADAYQSPLVCTPCVSLLQIGESGWAPPLPLESSDSSSQTDDMNTKPCCCVHRSLTRALCMKWWPEGKWLALALSEPW